MRLAVALLALLLPATASASTITVTVDPHQVTYVAAPGEVNDVLVTYADDAESVTVTDPGATITPSGTCQAVDAHTARCAGANGFLQAARVELGDGNDRVRTFRATPYPIGGVEAYGGPGDDELLGGPGSDELDGGPGRDTVDGGVDIDVVRDGDGESDVLNGGTGTSQTSLEADELDYSAATAAVTVDLRDDSSSADEIAGFESVNGGAGDDELAGTPGANDIEGGAGDDVIRTRGSDDPERGEFIDGGAGDDVLRGGRGAQRLEGGAGADRFTCGRGRDTVPRPEAGELVGEDCESVYFDVSEFPDEDYLRIKPTPTSTTPASATFELACPTLEELDGEASSCKGRITLREVGGKQRRLGKARFADDGSRDTFGVVVRLNPVGRRVAARGNGVIANAHISGENLPNVRWAIRLRT